MSDAIFTDNIIRFRHIRYPNTIIQSPPYIITLINKTTNQKYQYGSYIAITQAEVLHECLSDRIMENEEFESYFTYDPNNYKIIISSKK